MERKEAALKVEKNVNVGSSFFPDHLLQSGFPLNDHQVLEKSIAGSLGFMELLSLQDFSCPSLLDMMQVPNSSVQLLDPTGVTAHDNQQHPETPINSSSISSGDVALIKVVGGGDEEEELEKKNTKKELKPKKTNEKKQREPRFAFMTKSEVDHLEDGYRWRKYGQKAVKNSSFPRSYYRCTTGSCNVKKRVERSFSDPSTVVTTYEGHHTHPSLVLVQPSFTGVLPDLGFFATDAFGLPMQRKPLVYHQQYSFLNSMSATGYTHKGSANLLQERIFCSPDASGFLEDHGLLQDILPFHMLKQG